MLLKGIINPFWANRPRDVTIDSINFFKTKSGLSLLCVGANPILIRSQSVHDVHRPLGLYWDITLKSRNLID